jgi:non-lysosomal glucosylceramidase
MNGTAQTQRSTAPRPSAIPAAAWERPIGLPCPESVAAAAAEYQLIDDGPFQGVPLGGMGSGAIGRSFRGDFARWHLEVGQHRYATEWANQFSVYVEQNGQRQSRVLCAAKPETALQDWNWDYPVGAGTYYGLFPRAWFDYSWPEGGVKLTQEQFSPVIAGNERESSYPVAVFEWRIENPTAAPMRVGVMLTWQNFLGAGMHATHTLGGLHGVKMGSPNGDNTLVIMAPTLPGVTVSSRAGWLVDGSGGELWADFAADGALEAGPAAPAGTAALAAALAVTVDLAPGQTMKIPFTLAWDMPIVTFPSGAQWYKRYTRFWGRDGGNAWVIAADAQHNYRQWRDDIERWQTPILNDSQRPEWYKTALFNELYFLVDGGTLWVDGQVNPAGEPPQAEQFTYLECYDYPFYGTLDVAFYSSWALLELWPRLEQLELMLFVPTVAQQDLTIVTIMATQAQAERKIAGALPHDLGAPTEDPLLNTNAYNYQNINDWKDLNLKYVLRVYRDYVILNDRSILDGAWPTIPLALRYIRQFDSDGDGLLDHHGADQTYDTWEMEGASAYTGSLLIATLEAACRMADAVGAAAELVEYGAWLAQARESFEAKLWTGSYYLYNSADTPHRDSIMADQLVGQWYSGALGLPDVAPKAHILSALRTVYANNVQKFAGGTMGAVNGMRPDGSVDDSNMQSREVWTGTTYALAALMLQEGLDEEAWGTAWGVYNVTYTRGLWFRTPEAWNEDGSFRACMYMRPQSIWAIEHALRLRATR